MLNAFEVASGTPPLGEALSVYPFAILLILRPLKVATPATAFSVAVPESVPGPEPMARVTPPVKVIERVVAAVLRRNHDRGRDRQARSRIAGLRREYELVNVVIAVGSADDEITVTGVSDCERHVAGCAGCGRELRSAAKRGRRNAGGSVAG